jgi:thymidylate kinase
MVARRSEYFARRPAAGAAALAPKQLQTRAASVIIFRDQVAGRQSRSAKLHFCRAAGDRFESRGRAFQERVAEGLARWVERRAGGAGRCVLVDGDGSQDEVHARVMAEVRRAL